MLDTPFYIACLKLSGRRRRGHRRRRHRAREGRGPARLRRRPSPSIKLHAERSPSCSGSPIEGSIAWERRDYAGPSDLEGIFIAIACTDDTDVNITIYDDAERRAMLVNVVDVPPLCNFILPAILRTGPLAIAISTAGASPALAKRMKREVAELFGEEYAQLAIMLNDVRGWAKGTLPTYQDRKVFFEPSSTASPTRSRCCARATSARCSTSSPPRSARTPRRSIGPLSPRVAITAVFAANGAAFASFVVAPARPAARARPQRRRASVSCCSIGRDRADGGAAARRRARRAHRQPAGDDRRRPRATSTALAARRRRADGRRSSPPRSSRSRSASSAMDVSMNAQGDRARPARAAPDLRLVSRGVLVRRAGRRGGRQPCRRGRPEGACRHLALAAVLLAGAVLAARPGLLPAGADARAEGPLFARPSSRWRRSACSRSARCWRRDR